MTFRKVHPALTILLSFLGAILAGSLLLMLPQATRGGAIPFIDALFTASSAVCVTGLIVVDTGSYFSIFGQSIILVLIQAGGLGIMTLSVLLFRRMKKGSNFHHRQIIQDLYTHTPRRDIYELVRIIIIFTVIIEGAGFLMLLVSEFGGSGSDAVFSALFHSVSAFCNAGFSLFSDSLESWSNSPPVTLTVALLIILGGIGFPVIYDVLYRIRFRKNKTVRLLVQTKAVILTSLILITLGTLLIYLMEFKGVLKEFGSLEKVLISFFQSVTCRTAGFNTISIPSLRSATLVFLIFLMFVGASPGSCGGGIKTTTAAVVAAHIFSRIRKKEQTTLFKRGIPTETVGRSMSLILLASSLIGLVTFLLLVFDVRSGSVLAETHDHFLAILFEAVSAFGTVGLSMGITASLDTLGKSLIIILMLTGRVGILSLVYILIGSGPKDTKQFSEENIMIG